MRAWVKIVGHRWEHRNKYPNGQRWFTSILLGCSEWVLGTYEMSGYKNRPWPLEEEICKEDFERIDPRVFRGGEKSKFRDCFEACGWVGAFSIAPRCLLIG